METAKIVNSTVISDGNPSIDPKVSDKPQRRSFTSEYKLAILEELSRCKGKHGSVGKVLRREGLYAAQVAGWKREVEDSLCDVLTKKRGPKPNLEAGLQAEMAKLKKQNELLKRRLAFAENIIDVQKKISTMLGVELPPEADWP